jgi:hypothetical protein
MEPHSMIEAWSFELHPVTFLSRFGAQLPDLKVSKYGKLLEQYRLATHKSVPSSSESCLRKRCFDMIKMGHRHSRIFIGITLILIFMIITAFFNIVSSADAILNHKGPPVQGSVDLTLLQPSQQPPTLSKNSVNANGKPISSGTPSPTPASLGNQLSVLAITLNLKNIPKGKHRADIHQGSCPLNFTLDGKPPVDGPFTPGVTLPLGNVEAKADGTLQKTLVFAVGGNTGIPTALLQGGWFFCIHTGTLKELQGKLPNELFASLETFLNTKEGLEKVQQIACQALNAPAGQTNLTIHINGVQASPSPSEAPKPN